MGEYRVRAVFGVCEANRTRTRYSEMVRKHHRRLITDMPAVQAEWLSLRRKYGAQKESHGAPKASRQTTKRSGDQKAASVIGKYNV